MRAAKTASKFLSPVSDIGMPEMDGYMLINHIQTQLPAPNCQVCAIALTAYAGEANERQVSETLSQTN